MPRPGLAELAQLVPVIEGTLNRLVFTGMKACEWSFDDHTLQVRGSAVRSKAFEALATATLDRIGSELSRAGLSRRNRTPESDHWTDPTGILLVITQGAAETTHPADALVREYAALLTRTMRITDTLTIRTSAPAAQLALWWRAHARTGAGWSDDPLLEDIIELVVRRSAIVQDVRALPDELRAPIISATTEFLDSDSSESVIGRALADARLSPGLVQEVVARLRQLCMSPPATAEYSAGR